MTSNTIRAFALGLIVSTAILAVVFNFSTKEEELTQDEMIELLKENNYIVTKITEDKTTDESTTKNEEVAPEVETPKEETKPQQSEQTTETPTVEEPVDETPTVEESVVETPTTTVTLTIESGMNVRDVGNTLEAKGIVSSDEFYQAVLDSGKETKMKQGTFDIPSNATSTEVIGIIFK